MISQAYQTTKDFIQSEKASLKVPTNFGFGIGFSCNDSNLVINETNHTTVKTGMTFHVRVAFSGIHSDPARSVVAIGDTILVT